MEEYIGHNKIIDGFKKRAESNTLSHAHLIVGANGIGKSKVADIFSSLILNKELFKANVDSIEYRPKKASIGVDDVREIIEEVNKKPYEGDKKVITIFSGEKLTIQAQNALLKTIEEPPKGVFIIILTTSIEIILETIKSRCQIYKLTPLSNEEIQSYILKKYGNINTIDFSPALSYAGGIPGRLEKFIDDEDLQEARKVVLELIREINDKNVESILKYEKKLLKYKDEKEELLGIIEGFIRDIIVYKEVSDKKFIINSDKKKEIEELVNLMSYKKLNSMIDAVKELRRNLESNSNFSINLNIMLMSFLEG
ncbi:DNA polymerase III subunit delta' [Clostridium thermobutyricum]|uniref:DNA polymerase III subunit delta' n=1 Tax=Clostridium thermobutyricum DSM 4928 TaxID=1121339 RepID=A0A1V4STA4_9CLOT|nr:DNA polymerase III subunit delta' [Clostridium thermobutyricum]OPX46686.1 DNA polymerase III subunit delta' [Clostridium thermobutyricum DSM 4928]